MPDVDLDDLFYLCGNCGSIAQWRTFTAHVRDEETGEWVAVKPDVQCTDPMLRCPRCGWEHVDDDSNPGLWDGTRLAVQRERHRLVADSNTFDHWMATLEELDNG